MVVPHSTPGERMQIRSLKTTRSIAENAGMAVDSLLPEVKAETKTTARLSAHAGGTIVESAYYPSFLIDSLEHSIQFCVSKNRSGALLLLQISNMPMVISAVGNETSESMMAAIIHQIGATLTPEDSVHRVQRDQVAILLPTTYPEDATQIAARINVIVQNYGRDSFATSALHVIGTMGSVFFPADTNSAIDALDKAYLALSSGAPNSHRNYRDIHEETEKARQQMGLANYLYSAYKEERLRLAYQPVVETSTGKIAHYEALLRLIGPNGQISSAGPLIPIAERMGLIDKIDFMVFDMVVKELRNSEDVVLAFNVSNLTTDNTQWLDHFIEQIRQTPEIAPRLMVEITETAVHRDLRRAAYFVAAIQAQGCQVALDDFGSGYTSFRQLKSLPIDMVKIDGVFIKDLAHNPDNRFFVRTLLDFARGFGLKAVAEFVENGEIAKILIELGMDYMQGYYFGKPDNHRRWLSTGEYAKE